MVPSAYLKLQFYSESLFQEHGGQDENAKEFSEWSSK